MWSNGSKCANYGNLSCEENNFGAAWVVRVDLHCKAVQKDSGGFRKDPGKVQTAIGLISVANTNFDHILYQHEFKETLALRAILVCQYLCMLSSSSVCPNPFKQCLTSVPIILVLPF